MNSTLEFDVATEDVSLLARAAAWPTAPTLADLTVARLAEIAQTEGLEFATALVYDRALRVPANAAFLKRVYATDPHGQTFRPDIIGVVPGAFHGQHKHTGADGLRIAETVRGLADRVEVIPVRSFGLLDENAATILDWLEARRGQRIILTSLSKGGADLKCALASPRAASAFANVAAWISFSGIVLGTPLVSWLRNRPLRLGALSILLRLRGHRTAAIAELRRTDDGPLARWPVLPRSLRIVHVCGCPLLRHLSHPWAPRGYERIAPLGPNDGGGILLGDLSQLPGIVIPVWGADHYLQPPWDARPLLRSIVLAALTADEDRHATQSAKAPISPPATRSIA